MIIVMWWLKNNLQCLPFQWYQNTIWVFCSHNVAIFFIVRGKCPLLFILDKIKLLQQRDKIIYKYFENFEYEYNLYEPIFCNRWVFIGDIKKILWYYIIIIKIIKLNI